MKRYYSSEYYKGYKINVYEVSNDNISNEKYYELEVIPSINFPLFCQYSLNEIPNVINEIKSQIDKLIEKKELQQKISKENNKKMGGGLNL